MTEEESSQWAVAAVCTADYYWQFELLAKSVRQHSRCKVVLCVADASSCQNFSCDLADEVYSLSDISGDDACEISRMYTGIELCCVLKPYLIDHTLKSYHRCLYLDTDILIYDNLNSLFRLLDCSDVVLFPHRLQMQNRTITDVYSNANIIQSGFFNAGMLAASRLGIHALAHWKASIFRTCVSDISRGMFLDQTWLPTVFTTGSRVVVCNDPGHNIAYWNFSERESMLENHEVATVKSIHFSGFSQSLFANGYATKFSSVLVPTFLVKYYNQYSDMVMQAKVAQSPEQYNVLRPSPYHQDSRLAFLISADNGMILDEMGNTLNENSVVGKLVSSHLKLEKLNTIRYLSAKPTYDLVSALYLKLTYKLNGVKNGFSRVISRWIDR